VRGLGATVQHGNIEQGIKILRKILQRDRIFSELRLREEHPNKTDRKRAKSRKAAAAKRKWRRKV